MSRGISGYVTLHLCPLTPAVSFLLEDENMSSLLSHIELCERISKDLQRLEDILLEDTQNKWGVQILQYNKEYIILAIWLGHP